MLAMMISNPKSTFLSNCIAATYADREMDIALCISEIFKFRMMVIRTA